MVLSAFLMLLFMVGVMSLAWLVQRRVCNAGWIDVFWTFGTGVACLSALFLVAEPAANPARTILLAGMVAAWSLRLGLYIAGRVSNSPEDKRYVALREKWGGDFQRRLFAFIMWQPPVSLLLALTVWSAAQIENPLGLRDLLGAGLFLVAIAGEALSDDQMRRYRKSTSREPVMARGLWGRSRHPNYFFEWLCWAAYPVIGFTPETLAGWLTLLAPAIMYLVLRYGSGIPLLEASMLERKGEPFRAYQREVNAFFPSLMRSTPTPVRTER